MPCQLSPKPKSIDRCDCQLMFSVAAVQANREIYKTLMVDKKIDGSKPNRTGRGGTVATDEREFL